jgi:glucan 1,3-beta-glucosidase
MGIISSACLFLLVLGVACVSLTPLEADASLVKRASTYWYENIAHQGIAPFAPSGYAVYRNVKDFGAKGTCYPHYIAFMC